MALAHYSAQQFGRSHVCSELEILKDIWETETFRAFTIFSLENFDVKLSIFIKIFKTCNDI